MSTEFTCPVCGDEAQGIVDVDGNHEIKMNSATFHAEKAETDTVWYIHTEQ